MTVIQTIDNRIYFFFPDGLAYRKFLFEDGPRGAGLSPTQMDELPVRMKQEAAAGGHFRATSAARHDLIVEQIIAEHQTANREIPMKLERLIDSGRVEEYVPGTRIYVRRTGKDGNLGEGIIVGEDLPSPDGFAEPPPL